VLLSNPCKFRGKTIEILAFFPIAVEWLRGRSLIIQEYLSESKCILHQWWKERYFERKERWGWKATSFGFLILDINNNNVKTKLKESKNEVKQVKSNFRLFKKVASTEPVNFHQSFRYHWTWTIVVEILVKHYERTGESIAISGISIISVMKQA